MKYIIELSIGNHWDRSEDYPGEYTAQRAQEIVDSREYYRMTAVKPVSRLAIARDYQRQIAKLQTEREKLYAKALKQLKLKDSNEAFDWFFNDQQGTSKFVEGLK